MWTIGRALDVIARTGKIKNENNKPNASRLYMFDARNGGVLANSCKLSEAGLPPKGGAVVLEYDVEALSDDVVHSLLMSAEQAGFLKGGPPSAPSRCSVM